MGRPCLAFAFLLAALLGGRAARAEVGPPRVQLEVTRGPGTDACLEQRALEQAVERRLERPVFSRDADAGLRLNVALERRGRDWVAFIRLIDRQGVEVGERELKTRAQHCSVLDDSLALVTALLVDSPEAREHAAPSPPPSPAVPAPAPPSEARVTTVTIPPEVLAPREPYGVTLGATAALIVGPLPGLAVGPELLFALRPPRFAELRLRPAWFPEQEVSGTTPDRGGRLSLVQVALDVCPLSHVAGSVRFSGCFGQSVGWVSARGFGYASNENPSSLVYSVGLGAGAFWRVAGPVVLTLGLTAAVPLSRDTYVGRAADGTPVEVFRSGVVSGGLAAGLGVEL